MSLAELLALPAQEIQLIAEQKDTARAWLALSHAQLHRSVEAAEQAMTRAQRGLEADPDADAFAQALKCQLAQLQKKPATSEQCHQITELLANISHPQVAARAYASWAEHLARIGRFEEALKAGMRAEQSALKANNLELVAGLQNNRGVDYLIRGYPQQALSLFQSAHAIAQQINDTELLRILTINTASAEIDQGNHQRALDTLRSVIRPLTYVQDNQFELVDWTLLAKAYYGVGRPHLALAILEPAVANADLLQFADQHAHSLSVLGQLHVATGNPDKGIALFEQAMNRARSLDDQVRLRKIRIRFAQSLRSIFQPQRAARLLQSVIDDFENLTPNLILVNALNELSFTSEALGNAEQAIALRQRATRLSDSLHGTQYNLELDSLRSALVLNQKEHELATTRQSAEAERMLARRDQTVLIQALALLAMASLAFYLWQSRRFQKKLADARLQNNAMLEREVAQRTAELQSEMAERLRIEQERHDLQRNIAEGEKLRAIGQLTSGVAHDFNNLITVISLAAELLEHDRSPTADSVAEHAQDILTAAQSAANITSGLLAFARKKPLHPEPLRLHEFVRQSAALFRHTVGEGITLELDLSPCAVVADRSMLTTSAINLLVNAREAINGKGTVVLKTEETTDNGNSSSTSRWSVLSVKDHGPGMTPETVSRAVEPFYTTKATGGGTGLGLSMVYGFAKQSGGDLDINSIPDQQTVVSLRMPAVDVLFATEKTAPSLSGELALQGSNVLVVEDQNHVREVVAQVLDRMGMHATLVANGEEALEWLNTESEPDLLMSDIMMPGQIDGAALYREAHHRYPEMPILLMSGYTDLVDADVEFLHKPFSLDQLRSAVTRAMRSASQS